MDLMRSCERFRRIVRRVVYGGVPDDATDYNALPGPKIEIRKESAFRFGAYLNGKRVFNAYPISEDRQQEFNDLPIITAPPQ